MSEDEVHDKLCQILDGDVTTVARLNKASATVSIAGVQTPEARISSRNTIVE